MFSCVSLIGGSLLVAAACMSFVAGLGEIPGVQCSGGKFIAAELTILWIWMFELTCQSVTICVYLCLGVTACAISSPVDLIFYYTRDARKLKKQTSNKKDLINPKNCRASPGVTGNVWFLMCWGDFLRDVEASHFPIQNVLDRILTSKTLYLTDSGTNPVQYF